MTDCQDTFILLKNTALWFPGVTLRYTPNQGGLWLEYCKVLLIEREDMSLSGFSSMSAGTMIGIYLEPSATQLDSQSCFSDIIAWPR